MMDKKERERRPSTGSRRLYRQGSLCSSINEDGVMMEIMGGMGERKRTPSGKSIRSRTASRAEYHEDLKEDLQSGLTINLLVQAFMIYLGTSFIFGYNIGVLNQPTELIKTFYNETYSARNEEVVDEYTILFLWSITTAIYFPGGMIGAYIAGFLADRVGRKGTMLISMVFAFIGAILSTVCVAAKTPELLIAGRFVTGVSCGFGTHVGPMFLAEITPVNLRGAFGTGFQLFCTIGIFIGSVFGLTEILGTPEKWPYLLLLNIVPAILVVVILPFLPESPRYLMITKQRRTQAEKALQFLRKMEDVSADLEEMETESSEQSTETYTMWKLLQAKELRLPLLIAVMLQVAQQLSGINAIFFYSTGIYRNAGVSETAIPYAVIGTNLVNVIMTIITVPIMDKLGRRVLLLYPMIVMVVIMGVITAAINQQGNYVWMSYISISCVIAYVVCFAVGLGPIPWMIGAEIFRQGPRPRAMSIAGATNWLFTTIVAISFELIQKAIAEFTFIIFMVILFCFTLFVFFLVPETKNKTFEEIANLFAPGGTIEVEEIIDDDEDVFANGTTHGGTDSGPIPDDAALMTGGGGDKGMNGDTGKHEGEHVKFAGGDMGEEEDEKVPLRKSQEAINVDM